METLAPQERDLLLGFARQAAPLEACGFIVDGRVHRIPNTSEEPNRFIMEPRAVQEFVHRHGLPEVVWHSHPEGQTHPSNSDCENHYLGARMMIVTLEAVWEWDLSSGIPMRVGEVQ